MQVPRTWGTKMDEDAFSILPLAGWETWDGGVTLSPVTMGGARMGKADVAI